MFENLTAADIIAIVEEERARKAGERRLRRRLRKHALRLLVDRFGRHSIVDAGTTIPLPDYCNVSWDRVLEWSPPSKGGAA